jgi:hypothetical protein
MVIMMRRHFKVHTSTSLLHKKTLIVFTQREWYLSNLPIIKIIRYENMQRFFKYRFNSVRNIGRVFPQHELLTELWERCVFDIELVSFLFSSICFRVGVRPHQFNSLDSACAEPRPGRPPKN